MTTFVPLAGIAFDNLTLDQAAARIAGRSPDARFVFLLTPNADHLVRLARDPSFRSIYRSAGLCLLDSRVVARLAKGFSLTPPPVAPGSDLAAEILARHVRPNERITIIGLSPRWLPALVNRYGLAPPAHFNPPIGFDRDPATFAQAVDFVRTHPARFIFLAVGSPRQERLAAAIAATGDAKGTGLCIGASLDFLAGAQVRAPIVLQQAGLEWLFRLLSSPKRMARRYLIDSPRVIALLLKQRFRAG
jgi:exopolysaccharide biosynthesis WecB/TagA/CpsF family protein